MINLFEYQNNIIKQVFEEFYFHKSVMIQMPTGTGKTHVFCEIINRFKKKTLVLVHTRELVEQIRNRLTDFNIVSGIIMSGYPINLDLDVQVASIQTLIKKPLNDWPKDIGLIVIDEAHHATTNSYNLILEKYSHINIKILGVTATPCRMNNVGFENIFNKLIVSKPIIQFIYDRELVDFKHYSTTTPDLSNVSFNANLNDYDIDELGVAMSKKTIMADIIQSYKDYGNNKQCILFSVNQSHSKKIVERFKNEGINAAYIDSKTKLSERKCILEQFKKGKIRVLVNVKIFTEGFDCPDISVVQLVRPTKSFSLYMQMVGRSLRKNKGKDIAIIIDNAGLWKTHGLITKDITWSLKGLNSNNKSIAVKSSVNGEIYEVPISKIAEIKGLEMQVIESTSNISLDKSENISIQFNLSDNSIIGYNISKNLADSTLEYLTKVLDKILNHLFIDNRPICSVSAIVNSEKYEFELGHFLKMKTNFYCPQKGFIAFYIDNAFRDYSKLKNSKIVRDNLFNSDLQKCKNKSELRKKLFEYLSTHNNN